MNINRYLFSAAAVLAAASLHAQTVDVSVRLDSTTIFMGGQVGLHLRATYPETATLLFPQPADTLAADVEIVEAGEADTLSRGNGLISIERRYILTSFDSGLHYIPPIEFSQVLPDTTVTHATESLALNVINPFQQIEVDEQTGEARITDIKDAMDAPFRLSELLQYWPWLLGALAVVALIAGGVIIYLRRKGRRIFAAPAKPAEPCDVVALRMLEDIRQRQLWQHNRTKEYYSELTDTLRRYVADRFGVQAMESTTDQIMDSLKELKAIDPRLLSDMNEVLSGADFVKFARMEPAASENDLAMSRAVGFVTGTKPQPQAPTDEPSPAAPAESPKTIEQ